MYKILYKLSEFKLRKILTHPHDKIYEIIEEKIESQKIIEHVGDRLGGVVKKRCKKQK